MVKVPVLSLATSVSPAGREGAGTLESHSPGFDFLFYCLTGCDLGSDLHGSTLPDVAQASL